MWGASVRWRIRSIIQCVLALMTGAKMVCIDGCDILDDSNSVKFMDWLGERFAKNEIYVIINATANEKRAATMAASLPSHFQHQRIDDE